MQPPPDLVPAPESDGTLFPSRPTTMADLAAFYALHDAEFGPGALTRSAYRVREGQAPLTPFCRVLHHHGALVAAIRFTAICVGEGTRGLLLGPLVVAAASANQGHGRRLIAEGLAAAQAGGIEVVLLVGDPAYYQRFGFAPAPRSRIQFPGPADPARILIAELVAGAAARYQGLVRAA